MTDSQISRRFQGAGDFIRRELRCGTQMLYAYAIDGLTSGAIFRSMCSNPFLNSSPEILWKSSIHPR